MFVEMGQFNQNETYTAYKDSDGVIHGVSRGSDGAAIPADESNRDYKEFLNWMEAGNEPVWGEFFIFGGVA